ncbi:MAG: ATP-binding cassette domain-containing protein [Anaerolineaceae bacterium]|nr:ATP-binding cassette domain-containing protein [Anaerolineaceae bacterium]
MEYDIKFDQVTFHYAGSKTPALDGINLEIKNGEIVLITGPAGSGKTTLCSCINGLIPHYHEGDLAGEVTIGEYNSKNVRVGGLASIVGMVFQDPESQLVTNSVADEVAFGPENFGIPREKINKRVKKALEATRLTGYEEREPHTLSGGEQQSCVIAATYAMHPDIYVLDEPLANLDPQGRAKVLQLVTNIAKEFGKTMVIVEHALEEILPYVNRVLIMDKGKIVRDGSVSEVLEAGDIKSVFKRPDISRLADALKIKGNPLKPEILIREIHKAYKPKKIKKIFEHKRGNGKGKTVIKMEHVTHCYNAGVDALYDVSLTIHQGEFVVLLGRNGSGKTTLVSHLIGLLHPTHGKVTITGRDTVDTPTHVLAKEIGFCFQNPNHQIVSFTVQDEMAFGLKAHEIDPNEFEERITKSLKIVNMEEYAQAEIFDLGKGQKQRIALASVLTLEPKILVIDEPTTGQDPEMTDEIFEIIKKLNQSGTTVLIITHKIDYAAMYAKHAIVLNHGHVAFDGPIDDLLLDEELMQENSLELPDITKLATQLSEYGIPANTVYYSDMEDYLKQMVEVQRGN